MKPNLTKLLSGLLVSTLSSVLLVVCFPLFQVEWIIWFALVPLFLVFHHVRPVLGFGCAYLAGVIFFGGVFIWAFEIPHYHLSHHIILALFLGLYFGVFACFFYFGKKYYGTFGALCLAPFFWTTLEYIRSNLGFLSLPWPLLGHSQYENLSLIQIAAFGGAYSVSFVIVLINSASYGVILYFQSIWTSPADMLESNQIGKFQIASLLSVTIAIFIGSYLYGQMALANIQYDKELKISVIQGNIGQEMKAKPRTYAKEIMARYKNLTRQASQNQPDFIIWPEAATPGFVLKNMALRKALVDIIQGSDAYFVVGSSEYPKFSKGDNFDVKKYGNTALYFSPKGELLGQYLKIRLIPFGEYIPYYGKFPWPKFIVPDDSRTYEIPGTEHNLFNHEGYQFGITICWESHFASLFRAFVKKGANLMINVTNEGWFGDSAAPHQKLVTTVFRAVENRIAIARAANTGISCFIDPLGRITARVQQGEKDTFVQGYLTQTIPWSEGTTIYTKYGDWFVVLNLIIIMMAFGYAFIKPAIRTFRN